MRFTTHSHQFAEEILNTPSRKQNIDEVFEVLASISDYDLRTRYVAVQRMSLSDAINRLIKKGLVDRGWTPEARIFQDPEYARGRWRLDFAKDAVSIEVAFNHGEAIAWNLLKPVLASQLNHVKKDITTEVGVIICATDALKSAGLFDSAVGTFEKFKTYLKPLQSILPTPILLIGLEPPESFAISGTRVGNRRIGTIVDIENA